MSKGRGDNKGCDGELSRSGGGGGSRIGVSKGGGVFNGHGGGEECYQRTIAGGFSSEKGEGNEVSFYTLEGVPINMRSRRGAHADSHATMTLPPPHPSFFSSFLPHHSTKPALKISQT